MPGKCFAEHDIEQRLQVRGRLEHVSLPVETLEAGS
jgi:hypothetical protein